jgi:hypothetical protein
LRAKDRNHHTGGEPERHDLRGYEHFDDHHDDEPGRFRNGDALI